MRPGDYNGVIAQGLSQGPRYGLDCNMSLSALGPREAQHQRASNIEVLIGKLDAERPTHIAKGLKGRMRPFKL